MIEALRAANVSLETLRKSATKGTISSGERIAPGVWIDMDTDGGVAETHLETGAGALLHTRVTPSKPGRWCTFNIDLGNQGWSEDALFGVAIRSRAPRSTTARLAVRSFLPGGGHKDSFFSDYLVSFSEESTHCDVLWLAREPDLLARADWRTLIIFLDPEGFDIRFLDIRLFTA